MIRGMPSLSEVLQKNLRAERARNKWGQARLGKELGGWSRSRVSDLETGETQMHVAHIVPICRALNITFADLLKGCDPEDREALGL